MFQDPGVQVRDVETGELTTLNLSSNSMRLPDGRLVTMDLGVADVHLDAALANVAFGYRLAQGIADEAAPVVPSAKASDRYFVWDKDDALQPVNNLQVAPSGAVSEVSPRLSNAPFSTMPYALQSAISTETEANADSPLRPRIQAMRRLMNALLIGREVRVATMLRNPANYGDPFKSILGATAKWNGGATSNPVQDLYTRIEDALMPITDIVMSERTWHDFVQNSAVQKYIASKINVPGTPTPDQMVGDLALLGLPPIRVAAMKYKDVGGGYSYVWGDDVVLLHRPANLPSDGQDIATAYTYRWTGVPAPEGTMQGGFFVRSYFDNKRGPRGSTVIVVGHNDAEVFTSDAVSGLIQGAHQ
ncbi:major capsid protein [Pendulispora brunnea]|uniref:Major capsid protein n=1 Tax=Pendulispora brunnea TaxID=2905690 RepID=A0ABZ2KDN0_9BACT